MLFPARPTPTHRTRAKQGDYNGQVRNSTDGNGLSVQSDPVRCHLAIKQKHPPLAALILRLRGKERRSAQDARQTAGALKSSSFRLHGQVRFIRCLSANNNQKQTRGQRQTCETNYSAKSWKCQKRATGCGRALPEVMLHLRDLGLLRLSARTVNGCALDQSLDEWERSKRRRKRVERAHGQAGRCDRFDRRRSDGKGSTTFNSSDIKLSIDKLL